MEPYRVYIHVDLLEVVPVKGAQRRMIMEFVRSLADSPDSRGEYTDRDSTDRERQIKIIGKFAVTYWTDEAVKSVMVVDIQPADS